MPGAGYYPEGFSQEAYDREHDVDGDDEMLCDCGHHEIRRNVEFAGGKELCRACFLVELAKVKAIIAPLPRYFLQILNRPEIEVSEEEFIQAEQSAGFYPTPGCGPTATGGFSDGTIRGRIERSGAPLEKDVEF